MKFLKLALIFLLLQSCENMQNKENQQYHHDQLNHEHEHRAIFLDSIPPLNKGTTMIELDKYLIDTSTIYINPKFNIKNINKNLGNFAITSDGILFDKTTVTYFFYKGKYGCLNNLIRLDTVTCDNVNKFVVLDKIAFHQSGTHVRIPNSDHYWKMTKIQYSALLDTIRKWNFNDKIVNLKMDYPPNSGIPCGTNSKIFNYLDVQIIPDSYNH